MIELPNVTLFCISSDNIQGALYALQKSMQGINFGAVKLITHEEPDNLPQGIEFSKCYEIKRAHIQFDVNWGDFYKHMNVGSTSEDGNICVHNRHIYEALGCTIAPIEVAARFAHEKPIPETQGITPFGFHFHLPAGTQL
jgi:hypothetical protein